MNVTLCRVLAAIYRAFCRVFRPVTVEGIERLPKDGAVIVYANHRNFRDPIILHAHLMRPMHYMGKKEIFKNRLLARALTAIGVAQHDLAVTRHHDGVALAVLHHHAVQHGDGAVAGGLHRRLLGATLRRTADMEGTHGQLRARLTD